MIDWEFIRVSKSSPCQICGRPTWCTETIDGKVACCMRVKSDRQFKNGGYRHNLIDATTPPRAAVRRLRRVEPRMATEVVEELQRQARAQCNEVHLQVLASNLGLCGIDCLNLIQTGFRGDGCYSWPMYLGGKMVGIKLRHLNGSKFCITGSRNGMILPTNLRPRETLFVTEGATDTAAALTIGLNAIGRPSCRGLGFEVGKIARHLRSSLVVVVRDMGKVDSKASQRNSFEGARQLVILLAKMRAVKLYTPPFPARDFREAVRAGLTAEQVYETLAKDVKMEARR